MQSVFRGADDVTRTMRGVFNFPEGGYVTQTMSKGGGGACECLHAPLQEILYPRLGRGGGGMSCAAPGPALALDATGYMWIHVDTCGYMGIYGDIYVDICGYMGIHVDTWGYMGIYGGTWGYMGIYICVYIYSIYI